MPGLPGTAGRLGNPDYRMFSFFRLTAARNGRIPFVPQPRIEGRGVTQGALVRPCSPATPGAKLTGVRIMVADIFSGFHGFQPLSGIADRVCVGGIPKNPANVFGF